MKQLTILMAMMLTAVIANAQLRFKQIETNDSTTIASVLCFGNYFTAAFLSHFDFCAYCNEIGKSRSTIAIHRCGVFAIVAFWPSASENIALGRALRHIIYCPVSARELPPTDREISHSIVQSFSSDLRF